MKTKEKTVIQVVESSIELKKMMKQVFKDVLKEDFHHLRDGKNKSKRYNDNIMPISDVISYLGISRPTLHKWCREGKLSKKHIGRKVYFLKDDVNNLFEEKNR